MFQLSALNSPRVPVECFDLMYQNCDDKVTTGRLGSYLPTAAGSGGPPRARSPGCWARTAGCSGGRSPGAGSPTTRETPSSQAETAWPWRTQVFIRDVNNSHFTWLNNQWVVWTNNRLFNECRPSQRQPWIVGKKSQYLKRKKNTTCYVVRFKLSTAIKTRAGKLWKMH